MVTFKLSIACRVSTSLLRRLIQPFHFLSVAVTFAPDELNKAQNLFSPVVVHGTSVDQVLRTGPTRILRRQYLLNDALFWTSWVIGQTLVSRVQFGMGGSEASYTNLEVEKEVT